MSILQKQETHEKILAASAKLLRKNGIKAGSVAKVMQEAGLTVGGFYAHFKSKEALVAETFQYAIAEAGKQTLAAIPSNLSGAPKLRAFLKIYLSTQHRDYDKTGQGCPLPAMTTEMGKNSKAMQTLFAIEFHKYAADRCKIFSDENFKITEPEFSALMSTCVGGIILARGARGNDLSENILMSCYNQLNTFIKTKEK